MSSTQLSSFLTEHDAAAYLNVSPATLRRWRWAKCGPKFHKFGRAVRYSCADLEAFVENTRHELEEFNHV